MRDEELRELAGLARLHLDPATLADLRTQVDRLLAHFALLKDANTAGVEPCAYPLELGQRLRADRTGGGLGHDEVLANAPASRDGLFCVPRVVEG